TVACRFLVLSTPTRPTSFPYTTLFRSGYAIANISLKAQGVTGGDLTAEQMEVVADLAERYSFDELRVAHTQNLVLPHVRKKDLRSEEHTSELQSRENLVCRLLLEKKKH